MTGVPEACPDTGTCHHGCPGLRFAGKGNPCWRVGTCAPLGIAGFPDDEWPLEVLRQHHPDYLAMAVLTQERDAVAQAVRDLYANADALRAIRGGLETRLAIARDVLLARRQGRVTCGFDTGLVRPEDSTTGAKGTPFGPDCDMPVGHVTDHRKGNGVSGRGWDSHWNVHMDGNSPAAKAARKVQP